MPVIFISYRREDSAGHAGRLFDRLREHFGKENVFLDVVGIDAGVDFVDTLDKAVGSCDVLLAVIGREWLSCCDKQGRRRLEEPNDFIRAEISAALKRAVRVVPILVQGAEMPPTDELPEELRDSRWDDDIEALIAALEPAPAAGADTDRPIAGVPPPVRVEPAAVKAAGGKPGRQTLFWGIGALVAALLVLGAVRFFPHSRDRPVLPPVDPADSSQVPEPPRKVSAPDLVGLSLDEALEKLRASGLTAGSQEAKRTAEAPARQVLSQWPRAGKEIDVDSSVDLVYAVPPPDRRIEVPNVVGTDVRQAMDTLRGVGLNIVRHSQTSTETKYKVLRQEPAAGTHVVRGTQVTLFYAFPAIDKPPDRTTPLRVGGNVSRPEIITSVPVKYPDLARKSRITGDVIIEAVVDEQGNVESTKVLKGLPMGLDRAASEAVRQWKFKPAMQNGKPVKVYYALTVQCRLN